MGEKSLECDTNWSPSNHLNSFLFHVNYRTTDPQNQWPKSHSHNLLKAWAAVHHEYGNVIISCWSISCGTTLNGNYHVIRSRVGYLKVSFCKNWQVICNENHNTAMNLYFFYGLKYISNEILFKFFSKNAYQIWNL